MKIVALTGAGISAESGLGAFRDKGGLQPGERKMRRIGLCVQNVPAA